MISIPLPSTSMRLTTVRIRSRCPSRSSLSSRKRSPAWRRRRCRKALFGWLTLLIIKLNIT